MNFSRKSYFQSLPVFKTCLGGKTDFTSSRVSGLPNTVSKEMHYLSRALWEGLSLHRAVQKEQGHASGWHILLPAHGGKVQAWTLLPNTSEQLEGGQLASRRNWWDLVIVPEDNLGSKNTPCPFYEMCGVAIGELCACALACFFIGTGH